MRTGAWVLRSFARLRRSPWSGPALVTIGVALLLTAVLFAYAPVGAYTANVTRGGVSASIAPTSLAVSGGAASSISIRVEIDASVPFSALRIDDLGSTNHTVYAATFAPTRFYVASFPFPSSGASALELAVTTANGTVVLPSVSLSTGGGNGVIGEAVLGAGVAAFAVGWWVYPATARLRRPLVAGLFVTLAVVFSQRFDEFILISAGVAALQHVNPFVPSSALGGLGWGYPPLYVPWSAAASALVYGLSGASLPSFASLVYPGTSAASTVGGLWRPLSGPILLPLNLATKLPMIASVVWVYYLLRDRFGLTTAGKLWLLNPLVLVVGVVWGQVDVIAVAFFLQALYEFRRNRHPRAALYASLGAAVKVFPVMLLPFIFLESRERWRTALAVLPAVALCALIYAWQGPIVPAIEAVLGGQASAAGVGVPFSPFGLSWQVLVPSTGFVPLSLVVFLPAYVAIVVAYARGRGPIEPYLLLSLVVFYLTVAALTPQFFLWALPLVLLGRERWTTAGVSGLPLLYVATNYSFPYFVNPALSYNSFASPFGQIETVRLAAIGAIDGQSVVIVATAVFLLVWGVHLGRQIRARWSAPTPPRPGLPSGRSVGPSAP